MPFSKRLYLCSLWLVLGIEDLMKSGMVRPENDSVLLPMARFGIELIAKERIPSSKRLCPVCLYGSFRHRIYSEKGRIPSSKRLCLCFLWLVLGIEGLMKSGMVRPENDFGLRVAQ